ncbi:MAG: efflux RND transporter periplasmic adaptor subunit [Gemmatimonadetes bacterium]|uniref:Efflux RND transporter periplasmic adaptor subunit n=1 Tax=Candidatus Kutchimonas denitrificans TaxID=3056748 RepID=A0AAE4ZC37_9BACT|nr:efflux RND transporter periplasmic adaptor subunit [Gemmatimonadota bacterium]NIR76341.1 efflux RND transporter periplasmic adaptor subunit [Candidatus Kutchimonas denitrificans]NIS02364.1 efflux RND transporter periplasmic adaptor subunit [Gemmatimonadota bacterium]NIT68183.1 efflux RND transporter periplasmic adaptor subunit [Gemmatimonadota bacterium]NIU54407.1 efflux RND transporter periplasmic adaptor subunit [Gemmatimonadota bacterium]
MIERIRKVESKAALAAAVAATLTAGCAPSGQEGEAAEAAESFVKVVNVEVSTIELSDFTTYIRLTGEVEALNDVTVSAEESGAIERFYVEKGERLRLGQPIAKIRDNVLAAQVREAEAAAKLAAERYERQRRLWEDEGIGSEIAYLETKYQAELQAARLETLEARLERTVIAAPVRGIFDERLVEVGEMVAPGTPVARVVDIDRVKVVGGVPERYATAVTVGDPARISLEVFGGEEFQGVIEFVGSTVDPRNRTFPIEIVIDNPERLLKPRMVATVEIANDRLQEVVVIPQTAVLRTEDGYQALVVAREGGEGNGELFARARRLELGASYNNLVVVKTGLSLGDRLIVVGQQIVEPGDRVRIVNAAELAADGS